MNDDDFHTTIGSTNQRRVTKYSVITAFVLGTACVMYGAATSKQENISALSSIDTDIQLSLLEHPDLSLSDFGYEQLEDGSLVLRKWKEIDTDKVLKAVDDLWDRIDKKGKGYITKLEAKEGTKKVLAVLGKKKLFDEDKFNQLFNAADKNKDTKLSKDGLKRLLTKIIDKINELGE